MKLLRLAAVVTAGLAALTTACGPSTSANSTAPSTSQQATATASEPAGPVEITDAHGTVTVPAEPKSIIATDNRIFETLEGWGVKLSAAPLSLVPSSLNYKTDSSIVDLGSHKEPDLEAIVAANPDLILNGQRFAQYYDDIKKLAPDAALIDTDLADDQPFDEELRRQTTQLGEIFGKQEEAKQLIADFDESIERAKAAYNKDQKVMAVITSGGEINYAAPTEGRSLGPVFDILSLTPALDTEGSTDHEGDDISVEAIAQSNPDWILVMDRDAATSANSEEGYTPANELLANSAALTNVTAVKEKHIVYMPQDTYVNESIQTYTEFFNTLAEALEQAK